MHANNKCIYTNRSFLRERHLLPNGAVEHVTAHLISRSILVLYSSPSILYLAAGEAMLARAPGRKWPDWLENLRCLSYFALIEV